MTANIHNDGLKVEYIDQIVHIEELSFADPWTKQSFLEELDNPIANYLIALNENVVVAYGGFWHIIDEGHITNIAVHPDYRRLGIADRMIKELITLAKEKNIVRLTLEVRQSNHAAISLYEKFGFNFSGIRPHYYANGENAKIYWLEL